MSGPTSTALPVACVATASGWQAAASTLRSPRDTVHALRGWPTPLGLAGGAFLWPRADLPVAWTNRELPPERFAKAGCTPSTRSQRRNTSRRGCAAASGGHPATDAKESVLDAATIAVIVSVLVLAFQARSLAEHARIANEVAGAETNREVLSMWANAQRVFIEYPDLKAHYLDESPTPPSALERVRLLAVSEMAPTCSRSRSRAQTGSRHSVATSSPGGTTPPRRSRARQRSLGGSRLPLPGPG